MWLHGYAVRVMFIALLACAGAAAQRPGYVPPAGDKVPNVGEKAPDFTLPDSAGKSIKLSELLASPVNGEAPRDKGAWVLLIFYRGYW